MEIDNPTNIKITPVETIAAVAGAIVIFGVILYSIRETTK